MALIDHRALPVRRRRCWHSATPTCYDAGVPDAAAVRARRTAHIDEGTARAGLRGAARSSCAASPATRPTRHSSGDLRDRLLLNGDTRFRIEIAPFVG